MRLSQATQVFVSPIVFYEASTGLARKRACSIAQAEDLVALFLREAKARMMEIDESIGQEALKAFSRYGRGRHKVDINMGDCFSYACALKNNLPLLFKGNDCIHTDITLA
jgi:ribonuclease VapC